MKVAFDTNVLISAYTARGLSSDVFRYVLAEQDVLLSEYVLSEFERVLMERFGIPAPLVAEFVEELRLHEVMGDVSVPAALEGRADVLVTGDKDILDVRDQISGLDAMTPREFWESARAR